MRNKKKALKISVIQSYKMVVLFGRIRVSPVSPLFFSSADKMRASFDFGLT